MKHNNLPKNNAKAVYLKKNGKSDFAVEKTAIATVAVSLNAFTSDKEMWPT